MTYEELVARVIDAIEAETQAHWSIGEVLLELPETRGAAKALGSSVGKSASWVSEHRRAAAAFPQGTRAEDMSFGIHVLCARTDDPVGWLDQAVAGQLSTAELSEALKEVGIIKARAPKKDESCLGCDALLGHLNVIQGLLSPFGPMNESSMRHLRDYVEEAIKECE